MSFPVSIKGVINVSIWFIAVSIYLNALHCDLEDGPDSSVLQDDEIIGTTHSELFFA